MNMLDNSLQVGPVQQTAEIYPKYSGCRQQRNTSSNNVLRHGIYKKTKRPLVIIPLSGINSSYCIPHFQNHWTAIVFIRLQQDPSDLQATVIGRKFEAKQCLTLATPSCFTREVRAIRAIVSISFRMTMLLTNTCTLTITITATSSQPSFCNCYKNALHVARNRSQKYSKNDSFKELIVNILARMVRQWSDQVKGSHWFS